MYDNPLDNFLAIAGRRTGLCSLKVELIHDILGIHSTTIDFIIWLREPTDEELEEAWNHFREGKVDMRNAFNKEVTP